MSEQPTNGDAQQTTPAGMPIQILMQYVKDLSFENPNAPQSLLPSEGQPTSNFNIEVDAKQLADDVFEVELTLRAEAKQADTVIFVIELTYAGVIKLSDVPEEHHAPMLLIEGARLLFPFARSIIANASRDGGYMPFLIPPVDFVDLFRRRVAAAEEAQNQETKQ